MGVFQLQALSAPCSGLLPTSLLSIPAAGPRSPCQLPPLLLLLPQLFLIDTQCFYNGNLAV